MLFGDGNSALVGLSDSLKVSLMDCASSVEDAIVAYRIALPNGAPKTQLEAQKVDKEKLVSAALELKKAHARALSCVLLSCFTIESYINSFSYYALKIRDVLRLMREGRETTAELLFGAIERLSTVEKWDNGAKIGTKLGFDKSKSPYQDLKNLFNFRNDIVHDKVGAYGSEKPKKRYGGRLPDPVFGSVSMVHAMYAAETYWNLVQELHRLSAVPAGDFQRHYNLAPWFNEEARQSLKRAEAEARRANL
jgi:hypothetical protein